MFAVIVLASGCATTPVQTSLADRISLSLLTCRERPEPGPVPRQSDVARYIVEADLAGEDCRRKLGAVRSIVEADATIPKADR